MGEDWRLMGQERFLAGVTLVWKDYHAPRPDWDHDHCAFCQAKFMDRSDVPDTLPSGYAAQAASPEAQDDYHWVCGDCAHDFTQRFGWKVIGGPHPTA